MDWPPISFLNNPHFPQMGVLSPITTPLETSAGPMAAPAQPSSGTAAAALFFLGAMDVLASAGGAFDGPTRFVGRVPGVPAFPATKFSGFSHLPSLLFP
jgi:hypothetical protein